jgi:hypothetical protein
MIELDVYCSVWISEECGWMVEVNGISILM